MPHDVTRRSFIAQLGVITSLLGTAASRSAFAGSAGDETKRLISRIDELSGTLRGTVISVEDWRNGVGELLSSIPERDLMLGIDFERLAAQTGFANLGVSTATIDFGLGDQRKLNFLAKLFAVDKGRSIIPHGHSNMVSAHLPLAGAFRLRQYDQISRDKHSLTIRPTIDRHITAGDLSSIGENNDNVHWFIAEEPSYTFDVIVTGLDNEKKQSYEIFNLDMEAAKTNRNSTLTAPRITVAEALKKYG